MADEIIAPRNAGFVPVPEGDYQGVCVDVIDLGMVQNRKYGVMQHKVALVFQLDQAGEDGKQYEIAERFTLSLNEKAQLRKFLEQWRGRPYKEEQLTDGIPLHKLVGQNGIIAVVHNTSGEKTYANIFSIRPLGKQDKTMKPESYTRSPKWAEKIQKSQPANADSDTTAYSGDDDDDTVPF